MRLLKRNTKVLEYLPPDGTESDLNEDGEHTGEFKPVHGNPVEIRGNLSTPSGYAQQQFFGLEGRYSYVFVTDDPETDIREGGIILWKGKRLRVLAVRPSLNVFSAALREEHDYAPEDE